MLAMTEYIEGKHPVVEALRTHVPVECVLFADNVQHDGLIKDIERKAKAAGVPIKTVRRQTLDDKSERGSHQGVMAQTKPFGYCNVREILTAPQGRPSKTTAGRSSWYSTTSPMRATWAPSLDPLKWWGLRALSSRTSGRPA